jgi:GT2 family glycosyltransferase
MTATLFRRQVFDRIGMLDEDFVSYLEDTDFSIRLWRAGLRGIYLPQATALHHGGASSGGAEAALAFKLLTRNRQAILMKHYPVGTLYRLLPRMWYSDALWMGMAIRKKLFGAWLSGAFGFFPSYPRFLRKRLGAWPRDGRAFRAWLRESERAIYEDISARPRERQDTYWRMYFSLFRPRRPASAAAPRLIETDAKKEADRSSPKRPAGSFRSS